MGRVSKSPLGNVIQKPPKPHVATPAPQKSQLNSFQLDSSSEVDCVAHRKNEEEEWDEPPSTLLGQCQESLSDNSSQASEQEDKCVMCRSGGSLYSCTGTGVISCSNKHRLHAECAASLQPLRCKWCKRRSEIDGTESDTEVEDEETDGGGDELLSPKGQAASSSNAPTTPMSSDSSQHDEPDESPYVPQKLTRGVKESFSIGSKSTGKGTGKRIFGPKQILKPPPPLRVNPPRSAKTQKQGSNAPT